MFATSIVILALFSTPVIATIIRGDENTTNKYFEQCKNSPKNTLCAGTKAGSGMRKCKDDDDVQIYCTSTSPIQVAIGRVNSTTLHPSSNTINIMSTASFKNGNYSYCIEISAKASVNYSVQCRMNGTNAMEAKWIPFNDNNWRFENTTTTPTTVGVRMTDSTKFCDFAQLYPVPDLVPCDTWHMCAIELANQLRLQKINTLNLVDLSPILNETNSSCPKLHKFFTTIEKGRTKTYDKPGLLVFKWNQYSRFLLSYIPLSRPSNDSSHEDSLVSFKLKSKRDQEMILIKCQSSVLHTCGLQLVTNNLRIKNSTEECHMHFMAVELIPDLNWTITCSAFNEFKRTWDSQTECFPSDCPITVEPTSPATETPIHGGSDTNTPNENKTAGEWNYVGKTLTPTPKNTDTTPPADVPEDSRIVVIVVGAVLGGIFLCFLILLPLLVYFYKKVHLQRRRIRLTKEEMCEFMEGMQKEKAKSKGIHNVFVLPYDRSLELPKIAVDFEATILGSGAFGKVLKGRYEGQDVAIKTIDGTTLNAEAFRSLLSELKIMSYLGKHEHVMELVGAITSNIKKGEVYLILEYCAHGSALSYIRKHREDFISFLSDDKTAYSQTSCITMSDSGLELNSHHLVRWSYEVACGMEYVSSRNIYHGDLAARNILLTENLTVKVGDFGLSRQLDLEKYVCYVQKKECPLPLKWMAIESLRDLKFSIQSDVWSFGVTLWEFFSLGTIPYPGVDWNGESWKSLCDGVRLDRPEFASVRIYNKVMRICWNEDPKARPTFSALKALLKHELEGFNSVETCAVATLGNKYEKVTKLANPNNAVS